jgi:hypothetical protein
MAQVSEFELGVAGLVDLRGTLQEALRRSQGRGGNVGRLLIGGTILERTLIGGNIWLPLAVRSGMVCAG